MVMAATMTASLSPVTHSSSSASGAGTVGSLSGLAELTGVDGRASLSMICGGIVGLPETLDVGMEASSPAWFSFSSSMVVIWTTANSSTVKLG